MSEKPAEPAPSRRELFRLGVAAVGAAVAGFVASTLRYLVPTVLYEPLNRYETNLINTVIDSLELLGSLRTKNVKLLCDLFHMNIEEANLADGIRAAGGHIGHIHFVDSNRKPAGLGHMDYSPIVAALREMNYDGFLSAEALPFPDPVAAAQQTIETFRRYVRV